MPHIRFGITRPYGSHKSHADMARLLYQADSHEAGLLGSTLITLIFSSLMWQDWTKRGIGPLGHCHTVHGHGKRHLDVVARSDWSSGRGAWSMGSTGSGVGERGGQNGDSALTPLEDDAKRAPSGARFVDVPVALRFTRTYDMQCR